MDNIFPFRRLWWGPPRRLSRPHFLRERRRPWIGLRRYVGFFVLVAMMAAAAFVLETPNDTPITVIKGGTHATDGDTHATVIKGGAHVTVIDGDTIHLGHEKIRLIGIDAPEMSQTCRDAKGREWSCGAEAKKQLSRLVSGGNVSCTKRGYDRYGRTLAQCSAGAADLGETLLRQGYAVVYRNHSNVYSAAERDARDGRRGIWNGTFDRPEEWRRRPNTRT